MNMDALRPHLYVPIHLRFVRIHVDELKPITDDDENNLLNALAEIPTDLSINHIFTY